MGTDPKQVYELFFNPGEVVEIRVLGLQGKNRAWDGWASGEQGIIGYFALFRASRHTIERNLDQFHANVNSRQQ